VISRLAGWWRTHHRAALVAAAVAGALVIAAAFIWPITDLIAAHDVGRIAGPQRATELQTAREAVRTQLLTLTAGVFVAATLWFTAQSVRLARQGQVTDRYARAIEQLGSDKLDIRIGAIYALERIARDSAADHPTVIEVLAAFVREHSHEQGPLPESGHAPERTRPDLQVALTVISRRNPKHDRQPIDLIGANLTAARLNAANLTGAYLLDADLTRARLYDADLRSAWLIGTNLGGARLARAFLGGAHFGGTDLTGANLTDADLTDAIFPPLQPVPEGWLRDPDSGRLRRADPAAENS
jgi:Pentapeptide repeats (8 copies)